MSYIATTATKKLLKLRKRTKLVPGGTSAGKTIAILEILIDKSQSDLTPKLTSITSESFPHLRKGAIRDFLDIMRTQGYYKDERWSKTDFTYTFETGSQIEFFSADQPGKVAGPRRDRLYGNEVNNISKEAWHQMTIRTREEIWADWNPVSDFYLYEEHGINDDISPATCTDPNAEVIILTYEDNEALEEAIKQEIKIRAELNPAWGRVYAQGKRGDVADKIFKNWAIIDEIPHEAKLEVGGGDFGFAADRTAFCDIYYYNGGYIIDEIVSRVGLYDTDLATILLNRPNPNLLYIVDSADSQKVLVLNNLGVTAMGVVKAKGATGENFTNAAIAFVQDQKISVTKRSINYIESYRNFMWQTDKDGNIIPKYDHFKSDEMMSVVYGMTNFDASRRQKEVIQYSTGNLSTLW